MFKNKVSDNGKLKESKCIFEPKLNPIFFFLYWDSPQVRPEDHSRQGVTEV